MGASGGCNNAEAVRFRLSPYAERQKTKMENKLETLLEELEERKKQSAYSCNHLLDTIIKRAKELINNKFDTDTRLGF